LSHSLKARLVLATKAVLRKLSDWLTTSAHAGSGRFFSSEESYLSEAIPDTPLCDRCSKPMQLAAEKRDAAGKVIYQSFVCGCPALGVYRRTFHAGDQTHHA